MRFNAYTLITALVVSVVFVVPASAEEGKSSEQGKVAAHDDAPATSTGAVGGQVVVRLITPTQIDAITAQFGLDPAPVEQMATQGLFLLSVPSGTSAEAKAALLQADPRVQYAEANYSVQAPESSGMVSWESGDPAQYAGQWAPAAMRLDDAQRNTRGQGVRVAVLDSGVDRTHPALAEHLAPGYDFVDNDADPQEPPTGSGHGTHVAGLIALVAPEATIVPVRVLDTSGSGDVWRLAKGLVWASDPDGDPTTSDGADILNLSLATSSRTHLATDLVSELTNAGRGTVVVAAAGNSASTRPEFPAAEGGSRLLSVGATSMAGNTLATFSNRGSWVAVAAPGEGITSTVPGGGYGTWSGTSMAAALVSGEAALVRAALPELNARQVVKHIEDTSTSGADKETPIINAAAAVGR